MSVLTSSLNSNDIVQYELPERLSSDALKPFCVIYNYFFSNPSNKTLIYMNSAPPWACSDLISTSFVCWIMFQIILMFCSRDSQKDSHGPWFKSRLSFYIKIIFLFLKPSSTWRILLSKISVFHCLSQPVKQIGYSRCLLHHLHPRFPHPRFRHAKNAMIMRLCLCLSSSTSVPVD